MKHPSQWKEATTESVEHIKRTVKIELEIVDDGSSTSEEIINGIKDVLEQDNETSDDFGVNKAKVIKIEMN